MLLRSPTFGRTHDTPPSSGLGVFEAAAELAFLRDAHGQVAHCGSMRHSKTLEAILESRGHRLLSLILGFGPIALRAVNATPTRRKGFDGNLMGDIAHTHPAAPKAKYVVMLLTIGSCPSSKLNAIRRLSFSWGQSVEVRLRPVPIQVGAALRRLPHQAP